MAMNSSKTLFDSAIEGDRRALAKLLTIAEEGGSIGSYAVSYTHLTLPTILLV